MDPVLFQWFQSSPHNEMHFTNGLKCYSIGTNLMYNIEPNIDSDEESPPACQLEPRHQGIKPNDIQYKGETFRKQKLVL